MAIDLKAASDDTTVPATAVLFGADATDATSPSKYPVANVAPRILEQAINAQTTAYTLALSDAYKLVTMSVGSAHDLTVPPNDSVAFPVGTRIDVAQIGAGQTTVAQGSGVTVNATPGRKLRAQYSGASLIKTGTDTWLLFGDLAA